MSHTHQRLTLELSNIDEEETGSTYTDLEVPTNSSANGGSQRLGGQSRPGPGSLRADALPEEFRQSRNLSPEAQGSIIMQDWTMVAAGLERMFFLIYALAFAVVTSVYV